MESQLGSDWSSSSELGRIQGLCRLIFLTTWIKMLIKVQNIFPANVEVNKNSTPYYLLRNMQHIASSNSAVYSEEMNLEQAPTFGTYSDSGFDSDAGQTFVLPF